MLFQVGSRLRKNDKRKDKLITITKCLNGILLFLNLSSCWSGHFCWYHHKQKKSDNLVNRIVVKSRIREQYFFALFWVHNVNSIYSSEKCEGCALITLSGNSGDCFCSDLISSQFTKLHVTAMSFKIRSAMASNSFEVRVEH